MSFAEDGEKEYIAGLRLGRTTDTQDISGETLDTHPVLTGREDLLHLLPRFTGEIQQVPPMYSAVKIGGQKPHRSPAGAGRSSALPGPSPFMSWIAGPDRPWGLHSAHPVLQGHLRPHPVPRHRTGRAAAAA